MIISRWVMGVGWAACMAASTMVCVGSVLADEPVGSTPVPSAVPQENIFSSIKQAFNQDFDRQVIRGHFDVGTSPTRRYYCLVDLKTGKRQPNAVPGDPVPRHDGMTGIKATAVSTYSCDSAEQQGMLVTTGYVLPAGAQANASPSPPVSRPSAQGPNSASAVSTAVPATSAVAATSLAASTSAAAVAAPSTSTSAVAPTAAGRIDVAGIALGMSPEEVRAVLKSKNLLNHAESMDVLSRVDARYVNTISAWTASAEPADADRQGESYEIMFTPVAGKERAMAIVHSMTYSPTNAFTEATLNEALLRKYGGFDSVEGVPEAPTWRVQSDGSIRTGDACHRRGILGGMREFHPGVSTRSNLALKTALDEFQFQIRECGVAIATADHVTVKGDARRSVVRVTVSAYSPVLGLAGATVAAQTMVVDPKVGGEAHPVPNL